MTMKSKKSLFLLPLAGAGTILILSPVVESFGFLSPVANHRIVRPPANTLSMKSHAWLDGAKELDYNSDVFKNSVWERKPYDPDEVVEDDWIYLEDTDTIVSLSDLSKCKAMWSCFRRTLQELGGEERFPSLVAGLAFEGPWIVNEDTYASAMEEIDNFKSTKDMIGRIPVLLTEYDHHEISMGLRSNEEFGIQFGMEIEANSDSYGFVFKELESGKILFRSKKFVLESMWIVGITIEDVWRFRDLDNGAILNVPSGVVSLYPFYMARAFQVDSVVPKVSDFALLGKLINSLKASVETGHPVDSWIWPWPKLIFGNRPSSAHTIGYYDWIDGAKELDYTSNVFKHVAWRHDPYDDNYDNTDTNEALEEYLESLRITCSCFRRALHELGGEERFPCLMDGLEFKVPWFIDEETYASAMKEIEDFKSTTDKIGHFHSLLIGNNQKRVSMEFDSHWYSAIKIDLEIGETPDLYEFVFREAASGKILFRSKKFVLESMLELNVTMADVWRFRDKDNGAILNVPRDVVRRYPFYLARAFEVENTAVKVSDFDGFLDELVRSLKASAKTGRLVELQWPE